MGNCCNRIDDDKNKNEFDVENAFTENSTRNSKKMNNKIEKVDKFRCNNKFLNEFSPNVTNIEEFNDVDKVSKLLFKERLLLNEINEKIRDCPKLTLVVLDSKYFKKMTEIKINCIGLEKEDNNEYLEKIKQENLGYTFFGCSKSTMTSPKNSQLRSYTKSSENKDYSEIVSMLNGQLNTTNLTNILPSKIDYDLNIADKINNLHFYIKYDYISGNYLAKKIKTSAFFKKIDFKHVSISIN